MRARRIAVATAAIIAALVLACGASLAAELSQDGVRKGSVAAITQDGLDLIALDEMLTALGLAPSPADGGLVATFGGKKIEFWDGSAASRVNGIVHPLRHVVFRRDGHWWGEASTSLRVMSVFLESAGRPSSLKLTEGGASRTAAIPPASPAPPTPAPPTPATTPATPVAIPTTPTTPQAPVSEIAMISGVRWGVQPEGAFRAVIDISKQVDVKAGHGHEKIDLAFPDSMSPTIRSASPRSDLYAESKQSSSTVIITIRHKAKSVKAFWLSDPSRYVIDFYYEAASAPTPVQVPEVVTPTQTQKPGQTPAPAAPRQTAPSSPTSGRKRPLVVVDAGHGGHDPGAIGNKLQEKSINLQAALQLEASLKARGLDVILTRRDDRYLKLAERTEIANTHNADIFVSLHCNALPKGKHAKGTELYLMAESTDRDAMDLAIIENRELSGTAQTAAEINEAADKRTKLLLTILGDMQQNDKITESTTMAEHLYSRLKNVGISIRNVRQAPFFVLRGAGMPAVLVEMGYITEASDAKDLNSKAHRQKMMDAAALGILEYLKSAGVY